MQINKPIFTIIIAVLALILVFLFVLPQYHRSIDLQSNIAQKNGQYNSQTAYYGQVTSLAADINARKNTLDKIDSALPPNLALAPLVYFFQKKAGQAGLVLQSISLGNVSEPATQGGLKVVTFRLNLSGNYQGLKSFLSAIDNSARLFEVNSISFLPVISLPVASQVTSPQPTSPQPAGQQQTVAPKVVQKLAPSQQTYSFGLEVQTNTY